MFIATFRPSPRVIVFGAIDHAQALAAQMALVGARVTVCDARALSATSRRFPAADEVVVEWPHRCLDAQLTHDAKFDVPLLGLALRLDDTVRPR